MQRRLRAITLKGAIQRSSILLAQYWKHEWDSSMIISHFGCTNIIFTDCKGRSKPFLPAQKKVNTFVSCDIEFKKLQRLNIFNLYYLM